MHPKPKREGYKYHIFISYSRSGDVPEWIRNHFLPVLANQLDGLLNEEPEIFVDYSIDIGTKWPDILCEALQRSRCLLSVWTPRYFRSGWCLAEWQTMRAREAKIIANRGDGVPICPLVYPIIFADGEHFPKEARDVQAVLDFNGLTYPYPSFKKSERYLDFHDRVRSVASDLANRLSAAPPWDPNWTPVTPPPETRPRPRFLRL